MAFSDLFTSGGQLSPGVVLRRTLFVILLLTLALYHLFLDFRGISTERGMDQAQISREIARGNGFGTKFLRPLSIYQANKAQSKEGAPVQVNLLGFQDFKHAPLNPLVNAIALYAFQEKWEFDTASRIYYLDRVIATVSTLLFLAAIGINVLLISRIFDSRIGGVTALLMLFCSLFWELTQSGLPQMLMLFLFSFALYFLYKAVENAQVGKTPYLWMALTGGFFGLLALTHWLTIWIFFGMLVFSAFYFRPKGVLALVTFVVFLIIVSPWAYRNYTVSGNPLGSGMFSFFGSWGAGGEEALMRTYDLEQEGTATQGFISRMIVNGQLQLNDLYIFLGAIVAAPLFFLSLLHPFKRPEIASFRWCILSMWVFALIGMTLYSIPKGVMDPNQLHILFAPAMTGYGLAMLSVLWNRIPFPGGQPILKNGHFIIVAVFSAIPLLLPLPQTLARSMSPGAKGLPHWPPYIPNAIADIGKYTNETEIVLADCPWAVAWYADRTALWIPKTLEEYSSLEEYADNKGTKFAGIFLTPITTDEKFYSKTINGGNQDWWQYAIWGGARSKGLQVGFPEQVNFRVPQPLPNFQSLFFTDDVSRIQKAAK